MFERAGPFMAGSALPGVSIAEINGMLKGPVRRTERLALKRLVNRQMAHTAIVSNDLALVAEMPAIMTSETALGI